MNFIDYFAYPKFGHSSDALYKARLLTGILFYYFAQMLGFFIYLSFFSPLPSLATTAGSFLLLFLASVFAGALYLLRTRGYYQLCCHLVVFMTMIGIGIGATISGGPINTPAAMIAVMPAILALCLMGLKPGLAWSLVIMILMCIGFTLDYQGMEFIQVAPDELEPVIKIFNWIIAYMAIVAIVIIYEQMNRRLQNKLDDERNRYKQVATVAVESSVVNESADQVAAASKRLLDSAIQQKVSIEQLSTTSEELGASAEQNTRIASDAKLAIEEAEQEIKDSMQNLLALIESINNIGQSSEEIQTINNLINEISYQTNILSLNAMIEASRSSEGSGGFKVVALEVKKLAERSAKAAEEVNKLLIENLGHVKEGVSLSDIMRHKFEQVSAKIIPLSVSIQNVSDASHEQNEAIRQITQSLAEIDDAIQNNEALAKQTSTTAEELNNNASSLMRVVNSLDIEQEDLH